MNKLIVASVAAVMLSACASNPYTGEHAKTATGATIGAGAGAVLGGVVSSRSDRTKGALIGAAVGATVGGLIGRQMDKQEAELRRQMEGSGVEVSRQGDTIRLQAPENITFDTNRADVKPQFRPVLGQLAGSIRQYPGTVVQVEGHTDSTGAASYNQTLSENRAASVRSYLIQQGVEANRLIAVGYGLSRPIADNSTAAGRAQNRRVEILIVPEQQ
ncbi:OmpA family protein [Pseudothauera rhizosphaerae]|uniref:Glycine zipper 2TM domain-containing protein n=1 Tax=Pseudothauera rhizosphaerae TaxID=2565932 RepID=A0A4S4AM78_9RHOO|nr:OmpA family protein [Pseudothauera rhizosphaerae]THF60653.1 glycine zipper 2TM domain-containing protein [Pseudothauera rhizosphaerae]